MDYCTWLWREERYTLLHRMIAWTMAGIANGLAAAILTVRWLDSLLYGIEADDRATFLASVLPLAGVALFACLVPARRAITDEPLECLRKE